LKKIPLKRDINEKSTIDVQILNKSRHFSLSFTVTHQFNVGKTFFEIFNPLKLKKNSFLKFFMKKS